MRRLVATPPNRPTPSGWGLGAGTMALITVLVSLACLGAGAGLAILITRARMHQQRRRDKERAMESKQIKALMYALMSTAENYEVEGSPGDGWEDEFVLGGRGRQAVAQGCSLLRWRGPLK